MDDSHTERIRSSIESILPRLARAAPSARDRALETIAEHGPLTPGDLARRIGLAKSTVSGLVGALVSEGAVARVPDPADRRRVTLTALVPPPERADPLAGALAVLPPARLAAVADAIEELAAALVGTAGAADGRPGSPGPLLVVRLGETEVGIPLTSVREVVETPPLRQVGTPVDGVAGLVALRGALVPAVDLANLLRVPGGARELCVVVETPRGAAGLLADEAVAIEHPTQPLAPLPGAPLRAVAGALVLDQRVVLCLDPAGVLPEP
ncbi:MAG: chemotaxis protein CheW [Thermoleophilia bacterium]